ncbi:hypothetical protein KIN20_020844 [Parelaphostrongylus tenuis]|uniref:Uncharacterized protein n=1 Tax=Parelaphostrongylus tenuis TaxID=148309 RepID=A0AAD5MTC5_PARTN|nr:hypothetical protein KIN20_020844 [Parelaphostrongylus tenuis]
MDELLSTVTMPAKCVKPLHVFISLSLINYNLRLILKVIVPATSLSAHSDVGNPRWSNEDIKAKIEAISREIV